MASHTMCKKKLSDGKKMGKELALHVMHNMRLQALNPIWITLVINTRA